MLETTQTQPAKVASVGAVQRAEFVFPDNNQQNPNTQPPQGANDGTNDGTEGGASPATTGQQTAQAAPPANATTPDNTNNTTVDISEDQLKAHFEKMGIKYTGMDNLKEQLSKKAEPAKETAEEKQQKERDYEKRMVDLFLRGKGTVEQYAQIKNLANADVKELSQSELRRELKEAKFSDEQINEMMQEYSQAAEDELEKYEDENERDFVKRKKEYASKLMENRALSIKQAAEQVLNGLKSAIESEDSQRQEEDQLASKIDDHLATYPRKITFELGSENNRAIDPIEYEVADSDVEEIRDMLKDPAKRNQFLFNEEGKLNLDNLSNVLLRNKILESALKTTYLTGETKATEHFTGTFGARTAQGVGIGGVNVKTGQQGNAVSVGAPTRVIPSYKR